MVFSPVFCLGQGNASWIYGFDDRVEFLDYDGRFFYASSRNRVSALDWNGIAVWSHVFPDFISSMRHFGGGLIVATGDGGVYVFDHQGGIRFFAEVPAVVVYQQGLDATEDGVLLGASNGNTFFYGWDGGLSWSFKSPGYVLAVRDWSEGVLVVSDENIYLLDGSGNIVVERVLDGFIRSFDVEDDHLVLVNNRGVVYFYDSRLNLAWSKSVGGVVGVVDLNFPHVSLGDREGGMTLLGFGGELVFRKNHSDSIVATGLSKTGVMAGDRNGVLRIYDLDGVLKKSMKVDGTPLGVVLTNTTLACSTSSGRVYSFKVPYTSSFDVKVFAVGFVFFVIISFLILLKAW
ncbi:MAG TPA: hypothetical protein ENN13_03040 [Candidatus Altiarchaeales archaeon]|nr:hypothetical protein [Candidatus Altiarchaeales archaeon]